MMGVVVGDCVEVMRGMGEKSVQTCVTSPPYFGLRDYGIDGQIGLEPSLDEYVSSLVSVFREVRRVLRDDGTVWLNLGDSYVGATSQHKDGGSQGKSSVIAKKTMSGIPAHGRAERNRRLYDGGLKMKQLIGVPWRVALALQADGWFLRQDIIWHKPNPMPESVGDRCTKAHEYIFLLSKSQKYYFDSEAISEDAIGGGRKNKRSVWSVATKPYRGAHFATFPVDLVRPCVLAGSPVGGVVLDPFGGAGTTGVAALSLGRVPLVIELNPEFAKLARDRMSGVQSGLFR